MSVYDKTGLAELAVGLHEAGVTIVSTGSTAARIFEAGVPVTTVEEVTGFPECLDGRVKTLHPRVHAGILADRRNPAHVQQLEDLEVEPFDLVVGNLYPFAETVASGAGPEDVVEQIDIGGPSMVRAAAKNHASVAVVVDPSAYPSVVEAARSGGFDLAARRRLASLAFAHTAAYDAGVASWCATHLDDEMTDGWPAYAGLALERADVLRYGENPHQGGALYVERNATPGIAQGTVLHGKAMSYNNYVDADAALRAAHDFDQPAVAIIKHANPCGIAVGDDVAQAHARAHACDPVSAFGGVIAANRPVTLAMAEQVAEVFTEVVVAPSFEADAFALLTKKKNVRLLELPDGYRRDPAEIRQVSGGMLLQMVDRIDADGDDPSSWTLAAGGRPTTPPSPTSSSPGAQCVPCGRTRSCWRRTRRRSASAWARSTGSTPAGSPSRGRARTARAARWPRPTRSSRSPTGCRCCSTPACARWCSRVGPSATRRCSRPPATPGSASTRRARGTSRTEPRAPCATAVWRRPVRRRRGSSRTRRRPSSGRGP